MRRSVLLEFFWTKYEKTKLSKTALQPCRDIVRVRRRSHLIIIPEEHLPYQTQMMDSQHIIKSGIKKLLLTGEGFYHKILSCLRWIFSPFRRIGTLFNILKPNVWIISGDEISSREKLVIIYAGREKDKNFLVKLAFDEAFEEKYMGKVWLWKIHEIAKGDSYDCSLMIVEVPRFFRSLLGKRNCFYIPSWVTGGIDISVDNPSLFKQRNTSLKSDLSKIRRNKLRFEVTKDLSRLHDFYCNMYRPYVNKAHGDSAVEMSYEYVKSKFTRSDLINDLLLIKQGDEYRAGVLLSSRGDWARLWFLGVKDGNLNYVRDGAIGALFYFSIQYLSENNVTRIDFGASRPFLKDGVLRFKRKWNQRISREKRMVFLFKPLSLTGGVKGFFLNNPFIYEERTGLNGAIFVANDQSLSKSDFTRIYKDFYLNGLSKLVIYQFGRTDREMLTIVPSELSEKITVRSAESIFYDE